MTARHLPALAVSSNTASGLCVLSFQTMSLGDKRVLAKYSRLAPIDMAHFVLHGKWRLLPAISLVSLPCPFLFEYASCHLAERRPQIAF